MKIRNISCGLGVLLLLHGAVRAEDVGVESDVDSAAVAAGNVVESLSFSLKESAVRESLLTVDLSVDVQGQNESVRRVFRFQTTGPRHLAVVSESEEEASLYLDDGRVRLLVPALQAYVETSFSGSLDEWIVDPDSMSILSGAFADGLEFVPVLMSEEPGEMLLREVTDIHWVGMDTQEDGTELDRLRAEQEGLDWDLWVLREEPHLPVRFEPDYSKRTAQLAEMYPQMADIRIRASTRFSDWKLGDAVEEKLAFSAPEGFKKVDSLEALAALANQGNRHPLEGQKAPAFTLTDLQGKEHSLTQLLKGRKLLILDFWASWCGPCVAAMPVLSSIAEEYADRGVSLYAINLREKPEGIERFLKSKNLDVNVLLDRDALVSESYSVSGIPQTVLVNEKGIVERVHVGYLPDLEAVLSSELSMLLDSNDE